MDLGGPASYLTLEPGTPVYSSDGDPLGTVEHVLADADADVFDGLIVDTSVLPGGNRFVDASLVSAMHERGVLLTVSAADAKALPEPGPNPPTLETAPADTVPDDLRDKLKRAWDYLSGNY